MLVSVRVREEEKGTIIPWTIVCAEEEYDFYNVLQKVVKNTATLKHILTKVRVGKDPSGGLNTLQDMSLRCADVTKAFGTYIELTIQYETLEPVEGNTFYVVLPVENLQVLKGK